MKDMLLFTNFRSICLIVTYLFIIAADTAYSNRINSGRTSHEMSGGSVTESAEKTDSLPEGVTDDWLRRLTDENGNRIIPEDPEGDALQRKIFNGLTASGGYGNSVSSAGDVNGDGFDDIIIGASGYSSGTGRAYIYFGGLTTNTVADVVMTGEANNNYFGVSVSSAGDVNSDGYSDVIVGASGNSSDRGKVYLYFGGASMNNTADVTMTGEGTGNIFGYSVSGAGDVNGDGYSDVIAGANNYGGNLGRAYLFFGGASMNNIADVIMTGESGSYLGSTLSNAGDVNGDGYSDVIFGARDYSASTGRVYVLFGGASMDNTPDVVMTGETSFNFFGSSVSSAGDVNGDGYYDVIVGARGYSSNTGRAYIFFGGAAMNNTADVTMTGDATNIYLGNSVSSAGDVNCDGFSDVIVGANGYSSNTGRAYIYFGGASMNNTADLTMTGETVNNNFGVSVSSAGDMNGDGYSEMIIGAPGHSSGTGRVYLYDYFMKNEIIQDLSMTGEAANSIFGASVSSAGDVNGDGYSDVIVGGFDPFVNYGNVYIFFGGTEMNDTADVVMYNSVQNSNFGRSLSSAGDVNGDGYSDVIIGAEGFNLNRGAAYIYFGGASKNITPDVTMTGEAANNYFGNSVSSAGDVNGDGYSDVIVGASQYSSFKGRAYIYFGGSSMDSIADLRITGTAGGDVFGSSVSTAGDVNGDGYSDVIVGAYGYSSQTGRTFLFLGGTTMDSTADLIMTGEATSNQFGSSVSSAGDVNSDGYSDVIVGANSYSSSTGRAYIFFGGLQMDAGADVTMTGETTNNFFGYSVSSAGDVNGDGYSDAIVGAFGNSSGTGRAYVYLGSGSMNNTADIRMTGEATNNSFGSSVSSAGDVNGDGYSDLISGAPGYSSDRGRAYIYLGSAISVKPVLLAAKDVPDDQGGYLNLKFAKSSLDVPSSEAGGISYQIDRSVPPNGNGYQWVSVANISGTNESFYTAEIHTPSDSGTSGNNTYFFRVTAVSNSSGKFWRSNIVSGYSIDNIAPPIVSPFTATAAGSNVALNWGNNSAPDLLNYVLFRSVSPVIDPYTATPLSTVTATTYTDTAPLSGIYYYFIVAQDINGNYSPVAITESPNMTLNLTMFIEGFYNAGSNSQVSDTIQVELRNSTAPFAVADQSKAVVSSNGTVQLKFGNASNGSYYIAVKHRSSIETWSAGTIALSRTTPANYDISASSSQAFGSNMIQVDTSPVRFAIFGGDVNQDGTVDATDVSTIDNDASNFVSGYVVTDLTGDDFVDGTDFAIADNNAGNFVSTVRP